MTAFKEKLSIEEFLSIQNEGLTSSPHLWVAADFASELSQENSQTYLSDDKDSYVIYRVQDEEAWIMNLAIRTKYQGRGRDFFARFLSRIKQQHPEVTRVGLEVSAQNTPAIKLYEKSLFKRIGVRTKYYKNGDDAWLYLKDLRVLGESRQFSLFEAEVLEVRPSSDRDFRLALKIPGFRIWSPGQFVMLQWQQHIIGRPFAILNWEFNVEDSSSNLEVWIRRLGGGTEELFHSARPGMKVRVTLPLGTPIDERLLFDPKPALFISGGVGAASLLSIAKYRFDKLQVKDLWVHGEKHLSSLDRFFAQADQHFDHLFIENGEVLRPQSIEPGILSTKFSLGRVSKFFEGNSFRAAAYSAAYICGPSPMLEAMQKLFVDQLKATIPVYLGLEEKMGCGIGLCFSCSVFTQQGPERCCLEGPWFEASKIREHFEYRRVGR